MSTNHHGHSHHDRHDSTFDRGRAAQFNEWAAETLDDVMAVLDIQPGEVIADVGAGGGAFAVAFAQAAGPAGRAVAIDTYPEMLEFVSEYAAERGVDNVATLLLDHDGAGMPTAEFDLVFMRQVYHHLDDPSGYLTLVRRSLKPGGRVAVIDFIPGSGFGPEHHAATVEQIVESAAVAGLTPIAYSDSLVDRGRSFTIFASATDPR